MCDSIGAADQIVVLGSSGRLGRILRHGWRDRTDVIWQHRRDGDGVAWSPGDHWPGPSSARAIVALWGVVPGKGDLADNTALALAAQDLGARLGADRVLHCSSAAVYAPGPDPQAETSARPQNPYGMAKLAMEQALADWVRARGDGPAYCAMRIGNVAGADSAFGAIARHTPVTMDRFADGHGPRRSYLTHALFVHAVDALLSCPLGALPAVINLANPGVLDMADIVRAAGCEMQWRDTGEPANCVALDLSRLALLADLDPADTATLAADGAWLMGAMA